MMTAETFFTVTPSISIFVDHGVGRFHAASGGAHFGVLLQVLGVEADPARIALAQRHEARARVDQEFHRRAVDAGRRPVVPIAFLAQGGGADLAGADVAGESRVRLGLLGNGRLRSDLLRQGFAQGHETKRCGAEQRECRKKAFITAADSLGTCVRRAS